MPLIHPALVAPAPAPASTLVPTPAAAGVRDGSAVTTTGGAKLLDAPDLPASPVLPLASLVPERFLADEPRQLGLRDLRELVTRLAAAEHTWRPLVRHDPRQRWYTRLLLSGVVEVWLIGWYPGQQTEIHDHGGALGALAVTEGIVDEDECDPDWAVTRTRRHRAGARPAFGADHVHRVVNRGPGAATTIHAYSPPEIPLRYQPAQDQRQDGSASAAAVVLGQALTAGAAV